MIRSPARKALDAALRLCLVRRTHAVAASMAIARIGVTIVSSRRFDQGSMAMPIPGDPRVILSKPFESWHSAFVPDNARLMAGDDEKPVVSDGALGGRRSAGSVATDSHGNARRRRSCALIGQSATGWCRVARRRK